MVVITSITLILVLIGVVAFAYGTVGLSRYAFRIDSLRGIALLVCPVSAFAHLTLILSGAVGFLSPASLATLVVAGLTGLYTIIFAFWGLEEEGKELPTAGWIFGVLVTAGLTLLFYQPLNLLLTGQLDELSASTPGQAATSEYGSSSGDGKKEQPEAESVSPESEDEDESSADDDSASSSESEGDQPDESSE